MSNSEIRRKSWKIYKTNIIILLSVNPPVKK